MAAETTNSLQQIYNDSGVSGVSIWAEEYGDSCMDFYTKALLSFTPRQVNLYITTVQGNQAGSEDIIGYHLAEILRVLYQIPESTLGLPAGYVEVHLIFGEEDNGFIFLYSEGEKAIASGLTGKNLYDQLHRY